MMEPVSLAKRGNKLSHHRWVSATPVQDTNLMMDEEHAVPGQDEFAKKLEVMIRMLTDRLDQQSPGRRGPTGGGEGIPLSQPAHL